MMAPQSQEPLYFWRQTTDGGYLSQWYRSDFAHDGATYASTEMWMMASKARLSGDDKILAKILATNDPRAHKSLGRKVSNWDHKVWEENKYRIVVEGNRHKFTSGTESDELRQMLLDTGDRELVEASPYDRIWGIGYTAAQAEANRETWGENLLGKALMEVRKELREAGHGAKTE